MKKIKIFVGDVTEELANYAKKHDSLSTLLTSSSDNTLLPGTYYTSIGDLTSLSQFSNFLRQADEIYYCKPTKWSDIKIKTWTEDYLSVFSCDFNKKIIGYDNTEYKKIDNMLSLEDIRKTSQPQIWVAGCSITHGIGVSNNQRYGQLIADTLEMSVSFLTRPASSITWASSQLLRSDIKENDLVIWGVTSPNRVDYWNEEQSKVDVCTVSSFNNPDKIAIQQLIKKEYFVSEHTIFKSIESIKMVENMIHKINAKLLIGILLPGLEKYIIPKKNIIMMSGMHGRNLEDLYLDIGNDKLHPGPLTHRYYSEQFLKAYKTIF